METVIASACSCGVTCRWHGRPTPKSKAIKDLEARGVKVLPICPEMAGGLKCPRPPVKTIKGRVFETDPETRSRIGREKTITFRRGAAAAVKMAKEHGVTRAFMFRMSPSCAVGGITGKALKVAGIEVIPIW
ncbi:MAG: DUF523 domain-containing protein [Pseudomonadota bacterium]